jgi:hypothetical protein
MLLDVQKKFDDMNVQILSFQLLDIELPSKFNQAILSTQNLNLNVTTVQYQLQQEINKMQGLVS